MTQSGVKPRMRAGHNTGMRKSSAQPAPAVDASFLQTLMGYNTRRASLVIISHFLERMAPFDLRTVDFSVLSLIRHNPGITSRQLCNTLSIQPPNLVGMINAMEKRAWVERKPHPKDGRALGLHLSAQGLALMEQAEQVATELEDEASKKLTPAERQTLTRLLQKIYL